MKKIAVIPCISKDPECKLAKAAAEIVIQNGAEVLYPFGTLPEMEGAIPMIGDAVYAECDVVLGFGGDGSLIGQALRAAEYGKAILGCNLGKIGYLAEVEPEELSEIVPKLLCNEFTLEERMVLTIYDQSGVHYALNDVVISRVSASKISEILLTADDTVIGSFRSDGLIASTPTGSTAYSLSAGGSVIDPSLECIALTPICAHQFDAKPIIFSPSTVLTMENRCAYQRQLAVSIDGKDSGMLSYGESIRIRKAEMKCRFVRLKQRGFCNTLQKIKNYQEKV